MQKIYKRRWISTRAVYEWRDGRYIKVSDEGYWYAGPMALATTPPSLRVNHWAFAADSTEANFTANQIGSTDTDPAQGALGLDTTYIFRVDGEEFSNNIGKDVNVTLYYRVDTTGTGASYGSWTAVNSTSLYVRSAQDANTLLTDAQDTTQQISSFTFNSTNEGVDTDNGVAGGTSCDLQNNGAEFAFAIQLRSADLTSGSELVQLSVEIHAISGQDDAAADYPTWPTITMAAQANPLNVNCTVDSRTRTAYSNNINATRNVAAVTNSRTRAVHNAGITIGITIHATHTSRTTTIIDVSINASRIANAAVASRSRTVHAAVVTTAASTALAFVIDPSCELIREPRLLMPREKPIYPVKINWEHRLTDGLVACVIFQDTYRYELVSNVRVNLFNQAYQQRNKLVVTDNTLNAAYFEDRALAGATNVSVIWSGQVDVWDNNTALMGIPYHNDQWATPYLSLGFSRDSTNDRLKAFYARVGGGFSGEVTTGSILITGSPVVYGLSLKPGSGGYARFFRNGRFHSVDASLQSTAAIDWGNAYDISINGSDSYGNNDGNESVNGYCDYCYIYNRVLSDRDHFDITNNPYQFLVPA